jgi:predicted nucleic acid-binding protein
VICVDASVAAKWFFEEEHSTLANGLLQRAFETGESIIAPPLLPSEFTNILRQRMRRRLLDRAEARAILTHFLALPIALRAPITLYDRALLLAEGFNLPAVYDAHYVAVADLLNATLWTADQRLPRNLDGKLPFVRSIAEWLP